MLKLKILVPADLLAIFPCDVNGDLPRVRTGLVCRVKFHLQILQFPEGVISLAVITDTRSKVSFSCSDGPVSWTGYYF